MRKSNSPQLTSLTNCYIRPFFLGPHQIIGASYSGNKNPIDITPKLSST